MSRSRRKTPIFGIAGGVSEKQDKRKANRKARKKQNWNKDLREVSDNWGFAKDGKRYQQEAEEEDMRK